MAAAIAIAAAVTLAVVAITPRITFNGGLGYDGQDYGAMTAAFRGQPHGPVLGMHRSRLALPAVVAASGLDVRDGFLAIDLVSDAVSATLLYLLLTGCGAGRRLALLGVFWWAVLPQGPRHDLYYPVRIDAFAFALLLGLLNAVRRDRLVPVALMLPLAVLTRENLLAVAPIVWIRERGSGFRWATLRTLAVVTPAVLVFLIVRAFPRELGAPPALDVSVPGVLKQSLELLPITWKRILLAYPVTLGLLGLVPLVLYRSSITALRREPWWIYFLGFTLFFLVISGIDWDRNYQLLVPLGAILTFAVPGREELLTGRVAVLLTSVHVALSRAWLPFGPDEASYSAYVVGLMDLTTAAVMTVASLVALALTWAVIHFGARPTRPAVS